jgi:alpha-tubulin suppressor-like RCC1 family protein
MTRVKDLTNVDQPSMPLAVVSSLALLRNGEVFTWGNNNFGQLGNGSTAASLTAVRAGPYGIAHIVASDETAIAVRTLALGGAVFTWGDNINGQLGRNSTEPSSATPMRESARLDNVVQVATDGSTDLAVRSDGTVWGWGFNGSFELTRPDTGPQRFPVQLTALTGVTQVALAPGSACMAVRTDATVRVWGANDLGQRGDGTVGGPPIATPVPVTRVHGVVRAAAAFRVMLVIAASVDAPPTA